MSDFLDEYNFNLVKSGDIVKGKIIKLSDEGVIADIKYKSDAFISKENLSLDPNINIKDTFHIGDIIDLYIIRNEDENGNVLASKVKADAEKGKEIIESAYKNNDILIGNVIESVKGGVIVSLYNIKAFIPASQLDIHYVANLNDYVGKQIKVKIIEYVKDKKIVASQRVVLEEENRKKSEEILSNIEEGEIVNGTIKNIVKFGAFVDLGGIDGLIPISEISWERVKDVNDVLKIGDKVSAYVLKVDKDKKKITLSLRSLIPDPWSLVDDKYHIGDKFDSKINNVTTFGVFTEVEPGIDGLVYKSNLLNDLNKYKIGNDISVEILEINSLKKKISLKEIERNRNEEYTYKNEELNVKLGDIIK